MLPRLFALLFVATSAGICQQAFDRTGGEHLVDRAILRWTGNVALPDFDADGAPDLLVSDVGFSSGQTELWAFRNAGGRSARFLDVLGRARTSFVTRAAFAIGDIDRDGDLDVVWDNQVFANNGSGIFGILQQLSDRASEVADLADIDGDGDLDLLYSSFSQPLQVRLNSGMGRFDNPAQVVPGPQCRVLGVADFNNDTACDLVVAPDGTSRAGIYINDRTGSFSRLRTIDFLIGTDEVTAVTTADIDNDSDEDVILGTRGQDALFVNIGGRFVGPTPLEPGVRDRTTAIVALDADLDGSMDLLVGGDESTVRLLLGDGNGGFRAGAPIPGAPASVTAMATADVDSDGYHDIVVARQGLDVLLLGLPGGHFAVAGDAALPGANSSSSSEVADFDGDGDLDIAYIGTSEALAHNDGSGRFDVDHTAIPDDGQRNSSSAAADVDGDGDIDLWLANDVRPTLYLNDGNGNFLDATSGRVPQVASLFTDLFAADFDGDGDSDLYGRSPIPGTDDYLLINDGSGHFTDEAAGRLPNKQVTGAVGLLAEDFDGDGYLDMVALGVQPVYWQNDRSGRFTDISASLAGFGAIATSGVAGDIDNDGDTDLVLPADLLLNDGSGHFAKAPANNLPRSPFSVTTNLSLIDFDDDGDLDIVFDGLETQIYVNDGRGVFRNADLIDAPRFNVTAIADFDGDQDCDLLMGTTLFQNNLRQLRAPRTPRIGDSYRLEVLARPGYGVQPKTALAFLGARRRTACVPSLGCWHIDPNSSVFLGAFRITAPTGLATIEFVVPPTPALRGAWFVAQALVIDPDGSSHFTSSIGDMIR